MHSMERLRAPAQTYTCARGSQQPGEAIIFTPFSPHHGDCRARVLIQRQNTVGDLVMVNAIMIQLYHPLNFMAMFYREIKRR